MDKPDSPSKPEIAALAEAYAALNRNDIDGFTRCFDPLIERIEPPGFPTSGTHRGIAAVKAHVAQGRGTWAEGGCEPTRFIVADDRVVVFVHVHVRTEGSTDWIDGWLGDVFTFRDGKAIQFRSFGEIRDALEFAGVKTADGQILPNTSG